MREGLSGGGRRSSFSYGLGMGVGHVAYFTGDSIVIDKRHSGFPCRVDLACTFIARTRAENLEHERAPHSSVHPTSPPASASVGGALALVSGRAARSPAAA